ncbi:MAG: hypothetical protein HY833_01560, partial [Candidatus Aenigmarchaeota archaeon]|nr:hypothetical protein [Candidatus Aenigmarchaeota archaeon]
MAENKKISREALLQEKRDVQDLRSHLEEEYRKAEISERNYDELAAKYDERVRYIDKTLGIASGDMPDEELDEK